MNRRLSLVEGDKAKPDIQLDAEIVREVLRSMGVDPDEFERRYSDPHVRIVK